MILPLLLALQSATAAAPPPVPTKLTADQLEHLRAKLRAAGLPPGMAEPVETPAVIGQVTLAPLFYQPFFCREHPVGEVTGLGDALGTDCMVVGGVQGAEGFMTPYRTDGKANADWYGWHAEIHAPIDGVVEAVIVNPVTNTPGTMGKPPASSIVFRRSDGVQVVFGHIEQPRVRKGDAVKAGQVVAIDGNNGMARAPHIHVGAWKDREPLQIRWDLKVEGLVMPD